MNANLGNNPSYVWWSLLAARDISSERSQWRVGDGSCIEVSTHKWLSHKPIFLKENWPNLYIRDLIKSDTMQQDKEKIFDLFAYKTRMEILAIPLPRRYLHDVLIWKENKSQVFSVKSAYQVAIEMKEQSRVEYLTTGSDRSIWI